jgi:hypothetical protein
VTETLTATRISLEVACSDACAEFAWPLYRQLRDGNYDECAVLPLPFLRDWREEHRTARKRSDRAMRRGYSFTTIERHRRADEIHMINTSAGHRQGRPMSDGYLQRPSETPLPTYPCARHAIRTYGVEDREQHLVAYAYIYRAGQLALVSQILGHVDHLENEVMYLLVQDVLKFENMIDRDGMLVYNRYDSGTDGLRFFKDRCGFAPTQVEWQQ